MVGCALRRVQRRTVLDRNAGPWKAI